MRFIRSTTTTLAGLLILASGLAGRAQAQQGAVITGKVVSDAGVPLPGANVLITEMGFSVGTNAQGVYRIDIPAARVSGQTVQLRARSVGFTPTARAIVIKAGTQTADFELKTDVLRLSEVVVTGVAEGTERAKVPFAVGRITAEDLPVPALDPVKALAGKVSGLRVASTGGQPGTNPEIMLRGPTSINASGRGQGPLIIVDGAIMNVGSLNEIGGLDIESVEVVKGAAGASLYGTRAGAGVITITTKRGSSNGDGVKFNVRSEYGFSDLNSINYGQPVNHQLQLDETGKRFCVQGSGNIASCSRTLDWMKEILRINNVNADTTRTPQLVQWNAPSASGGDLQNVFQSQQWPGQYYNMLAQVLRRNPVALEVVDASGRVGSVNFFVSGQYQDEQGAIRGLKGNQQRRARVNLDYSARKDLTIQVSSLYDNQTNDNRSGGSSNGGIFGQALRGAAAGTDYLARDTLGRFLVRGGGASLRSPTGNGAGTFLYDTENLFAPRTSDRYLGSITTRYFPKEWFTLEGTFAYDQRNRVDMSGERKGYRTNGLSLNDNLGNWSASNRREASWNAAITGTIRHSFSSDLNAKLTFRGLADNDKVTANNGSGTQFRVADVYTLTNTTQNKSVGSSSLTIRNVGVVGGASVDFKDRYTIDGYYRYDGSSLFGSGNRYAPYGRLSAVWQVSKEPFYHFDFLGDLRLRASRGTAGNPPSFDAQYERYNISATGVSLGTAGNSKLKPEVTTETEFGTDFTLFSRLGVELNRALGTTKNQILLVNTPAALGFSQQWQNAGTLSNRTWEVSLNLPVINKRNFNWSMGGTWDQTRTYITQLFTSEYVTDAGTGQGTGSAFHITANPAKLDGFQQNRYGNIWGRKFYKSCSDMPASLQSKCGDGLDFQRNDEGYVVWVGAGNSYKDGITRNLWQTKLPGAQSPFGDAVPLFWGMPIVDRPLRGQPGEGVGINHIIGNSLPDFRATYRNNVTWKRLSAYALLDGTFGHDIINQGEGWGLLDFSSSHFDQSGKSVETAKPVGYSWRSGPSESTGIGGFYDTLNPNNYVVEDGSYVKVREISLSYHVGRVRGVGDWTLGVVGRNLFTITGYSGLDPETGATGGANQSGSGLVNQTDAFGFPNLRQFSFSLSTRF